MTEDLNLVMASQQEMINLLKTAQDTGQTIEKLIEGFSKITLDKEPSSLVLLPTKLKKLTKYSHYDKEKVKLYLSWEDVKELLDEIEESS